MPEHDYGDSALNQIHSRYRTERAIKCTVTVMPIAHQNLTAEDFRTAALKAAVPEVFATILSDTDAGVANGALFDNGGDLARLIRRPTTSFGATVAEFAQH
jgi:NAD(P)H dehydrogenase (quinone)